MFVAERVLRKFDFHARARRDVSWFVLAQTWPSRHVAVRDLTSAQTCAQTWPSRQFAV